MNGHGIRGLVGQGMDGRRSGNGLLSRIVKVVDKLTGSGTVTSPAYETVCEIYLWGAGGGGDGNTVGGGGAGACYKRLLLGPSQQLSFSIGAAGISNGGLQTDGGDTVVNGPGGLVLTARGGAKNGAGGTGAGGTASGGDLNRTGGNGGPNGTAGEFGGAGGAGGGFGGGGGAAGFSDLGDLSGGTGGFGLLSIAPTTPGGGGSHSIDGAAGRVLIIFTRIGS